MSIAIAILGLAALVMIHEAGHFVVARAVGMRPRKFYLGFGPAIVKTVRGGVEYGIGSIPLGGYVKIPGMHRAAPGDLRKSLPPVTQEALHEPLAALDDALERGDEAAARAQLPLLAPQLANDRMFEELEGSLAPDAYWRQTTWKRVAVIAAGPAVNMIAALALFLPLYMAGTSVASNRVGSLLPGHPAAAAGVEVGDRIIMVAGHRANVDTIRPELAATRGRPFTLVVDRHGRDVTLGPLRARKEGTSYLIGVSLYSPAPGQSAPQAAWSSIKLVGIVTRDSITAFAGLTHGQGTKNISSTVGIVQTTSEAYRSSLRDYFFYLGLISLALAVFNLLPLLPLDGGHIVMSLLERLRGRAFSQLVYIRYSAVGFVLIMFVFFIGLHNNLTGTS